MNACKSAVTAVFLLACSTLFAIPIVNKKSDDQGPWVVRVYNVNADNVSQIEQQFDVWGVDISDGYATVSISSPNEFKLLEAIGLPVRIDPKMTERYRVPLTEGFSAKTIPNFPCYRTVEETLDTMQQLVNQNPNIAEIIDIGDSWERTQSLADGFDLRVIRLTNRSITGDKPVLFVMSAIHAREYTTAETMTRFAELLANGYNQDPDITWLVDHHEIHLLLQANPDGRKQAEAGALWRKNTNENYCSPTSPNRGADLNRNFPFEWGGAASTDPCNTTYQGPSASSEPEVTAVVDYVRSIFPDQRGDQVTDPAPADATGVFIDVHSFSQLVLWPWGFSFGAGQAPNQDELSVLGRRLAFFNGYRPQQILGLTAASGSTADFAYGELGVASFAYELGTEFFQACEFFENSIAQQNIDSMVYAAKVARTPYQTPSGPDVTSVIVSPNTLLPGENANVQIQADGTRFSTVPDATSPLENPRPISGVEVFLNALPWEDPATANATASDGTFGGTEEAATAALDTTGLPQGRYPVFTQAVGQDSQAGAITAGFVFILDPATAGRIFGQVTVEGAGTPVGNALIQAGPYQVTSDPSGNYSLNLPPGSYTVEVSAEGFGSSTVDIVISNTQQLPLNLNVPNRCILFTDDVEGGDIGWSADTPWAITSEQSSSPASAWHDSPGGNYQNNLNLSLESPVIDLSQASESVLSFNHLCDTEAGFDFGIVEISTDGNQWDEVYRCDNQPAFQNQTLDVSALDGAATAQIRFRLTTDVAVTDNGWYVDDVQVSGVGQACLAANPDFVFADGFE